MARRAVPQPGGQDDAPGGGTARTKDGKEDGDGFRPHPWTFGRVVRRLEDHTAEDLASLLAQATKAAPRPEAIRGRR